ncbi:tetratricopeptide repeat protein [bacterium]|nr:tetratricopeptide repeat protein [bacterium]
MNKNLLATLFIFSVPFSLMAAEPSAFGAGNLDHSDPYGLTTSEKVILENKNSLRKVEVKTNNQANEVESLRERVDGLQSIIENLSRKAHSNEVLLEQMSAKNGGSAQSEYEQRITGLSQANSESIEKIKVLLSEMSQQVDTINSKYVTKDELKAMLNGLSQKATVATTKSQKTSDTTEEKSSSSELSSMSTVEISTAAQAFYDKKYYTNAIEYYGYLIEKNYKPAYAHYMIADMNFRRKNYDEAISYYKQSATLYSDASYMPELMLNTAISMEATGDTTNAKAFYKGVIAKYPGSSEAKKAQKQLNLIK